MEEKTGHGHLFDSVVRQCGLRSGNKPFTPASHMFDDLAEEHCPVARGLVSLTLGYQSPEGTNLCKWHLSYVLNIFLHRFSPKRETGTKVI